MLCGLAGLRALRSVLLSPLHGVFLLELSSAGSAGGKLQHGSELLQAHLHFLLPVCIAWQRKH